MTRFATLTFTVLAFVAAAHPASAQSVGVGYQFLRALPSGEDAVNYPVGASVDIAVPVRGRWQAVAEAGWSKNGDGALGVAGTLTALSYGAGVRYATSEGWAPYGQVIVGYHRDAINDFAETTLMFQPGGGASHAIGSRLRLFGQFDLRRILYDDGLGHENDLRIVAGLRFQLGR